MNPLPSTIPPEAADMLDDPEVIQCLKEAYLDTYAEHERQKHALHAAHQRIQRQDTDAFSTWFVCEACTALTTVDTRQRIRTLNQLRTCLLPSSPTYAAEHKQHANWHARIADAKSVPILDVIHRYIETKKSARRCVACCPFHHEKTPSFTIYPDTNTAHCFGCGWHGDGIKFLMDYCRIPFKTAVNDLST